MSSSVVSITGLMALAALVAQNTTIALTMRLAVTSHSGFHASTAVCCDEALKLSFCVLMMLYFYLSRPQRGEAQPLMQRPAASLRGFGAFLQGELCADGSHEYLKMCVPALLYTIQKNLLYLALRNLHAVVYQVMSQSKILTTAAFSFMILGRHLRLHQLLALGFLIGGVVAVQISAYSGTAHPKEASAEGDALLGISAVLMVSLTSGFSSVYFEYMLKRSGSNVDAAWSLWVRNVQLASFALPIAAITAILTDGSSIKEHGFFYGYLPITWIVIILEASGGIFVALVTKYADSILKNFATALAIVVSAAFSAMYMGFKVTPLFMSGAMLVLFSIFLYSHQPAPTKLLQDASPGASMENGIGAAAAIARSGGAP